MPCEGCTAQFTVLRRRRVCGDCGRHFCSGCVSRGARQVCRACRVLATRPLARTQLDRLKIRDLQCYLHRQKVSTAGCVEKEDLVNLVVNHVNSGSFIHRPPPHQQNEFTQALASIKGFTTNLLNSAFDIGSHNGDKSHKNRHNNNRAQNVPHTSGPSSASQQNANVPKPTTSRSESNINPQPPPPSNAQPRNTPSISGMDHSEMPFRPPQCIVTNTSGDDEIHDPHAELTDTNDCLEIEDDPDDPDWEIVTPPADPLPQDSDILLLDNDVPLRATARAASDLDLPSRTGDNSSSGDTSSLKNMPMTAKISSSRINLDDLKEFSQIEGLNVKQLKELLILNRVDFKGCCERKELLERAERLWRESTKSREDLETTGNEELCKICMDAPMECVMLECGHIATCVQCGKRLNECPICRQYVVRVVRFFRS
ncbi:E3 ubiquitin-protein ligase RNF34 isoform X2 [Arctopsyche grandis]|uniref:E3 ubiquitin-protein ligase RNF34 isoform X2 n=1 Tax=Arctopsyche grandis TaxID=121162 RepID=UPI00406D7BF1